MPERYTEISKFLSYVLRHAPHAIGITLDREGWASIHALIDAARKTGRKLDEALIHLVVAESEKKRFAISEDGLRIRAVQGHSTQSVSIAHTEQTPPEFLFHGTATRFIEAIEKEGLKAGRRHHVHLSADADTAISVGKRHGKPIVLTVCAGKMHRQGVNFFQADNGVWLVDKVPFEFIELPSGASRTSED